MNGHHKRTTQLLVQTNNAGKLLFILWMREFLNHRYHGARLFDLHDSLIMHGSIDV